MNGFQFNEQDLVNKKIYQDDTKLMEQKIQQIELDLADGGDVIVGGEFVNPTSAEIVAFDSGTFNVMTDGIVRVRRGTETQIPASMVEGEIGVITDNKGLVIGTGSGTEIFKFNKPSYYPNIASMKADRALKHNDMAIVLGTLVPCDGGCAFFHITNDPVLVADETYIYALNNGLKANSALRVRRG